MRAAFGSHPALKLRLGKEVVQELRAGNNAYRGPVLAVGICPAEGKRRRVERRGAMNGGSPAKGQSWGRGQPDVGLPKFSFCTPTVIVKLYLSVGSIVRKTQWA